MKRLQCKDIPDRPILERLQAERVAARGKRAAWVFLRPSGNDWPCVLEGMPQAVAELPAGDRDRLALAKMRQLIRRGLAEGCTCGCRGDFEITAKGREWLK